MKLFRRLLCAAVILVMALGLGGASLAAQEDGQRLTILFTHDTHDHWLPMPDEEGGEYGGYTRLATLLRQQRAQAEGAVVTLDAGDFSMGSLFQTIYATEAPELRALGAMGYDVTTLGNHEFDYRKSGLTAMLRAAILSGDPLPAIVQANYKPPEDDQDAWSAWNRYGITDYVMVERDGVRVAVFGLMGEDADACAPMSGMEFEPIADAARRVVADIQAREDADFIICLSHSGTSPDPKQSEDELLAREVDGIDVIISGHTHSITREPLRVNDTLIVSCGPYTENLGVLTVAREGGGLEVESFQLIPVDETVAEDPAMTAMAEGFQTQVEEQYLSGYGLTFDQVLTRASFSFTPISRFGAVQEDDSLGSLIADSYEYAVRQAEGEDYVPVDFAVVAAGVIRASLAAGDVTTSDVFNVSSLGSGADGTPGYPLISVWVTGKELKDAFEVDASVAPLMPAAQIYGAGMTWTYNTNRMIFNKVTDCAQVLEDGTTAPLEDDRLYRVVTGLYTGQMLGEVNGKSFGILTITPKDAQGNPVEDFEDHIIYTQQGTELKEWYALASYLSSMDTIPLDYVQPQGRKVVYSSWNPIDLLKHPNLFTVAAVLLVLAAAALAAGVARLVIRRAAGRGGRRPRGGYRGYRGRRR